MFRIRLKDLREKAGYSQYSFAKAIGVAQSTVGNWESGKREPNFDTTQKLANFFNVSVDYLLGRDDSAETKKEAALESDDFTYALYGEFRHLSEADKEQLLNMARFLRQQQEAKNGKNGKSD